MQCQTRSKPRSKPPENLRVFGKTPRGRITLLEGGPGSPFQKCDAPAWGLPKDTEVFRGFGSGFGSGLALHWLSFASGRPWCCGRRATSRAARRRARKPSPACGRHRAAPAGTTKLAPGRTFRPRAPSPGRAAGAGGGAAAPPLGCAAGMGGRRGAPSPGRAAGAGGRTAAPPLHPLWERQRVWRMRRRDGGGSMRTQTLRNRLAPGGVVARRRHLLPPAPPAPHTGLPSCQYWGPLRGCTSGLSCVGQYTWCLRPRGP